MPAYDYECSECEKRWEVIKPMVNYTTKEECPTCGASAFKIFVSVPSFHIFQPYFDKSLGMPMTSRRERDRIMKKNDMVNVGEYKHIDDIPVGKPDQESDIDWNDKKIQEEWIETCQSVGITGD